MKGLTLAGVDQELSTEILAYLGLQSQGSAGIERLETLVEAYTRQVPWESVSRIVKKARVIEENGAAEGHKCARWPGEFWREAMARGTGGTCFESNYAFLALLETLGYSGYLTVNNMEPTIGCHSAIVLIMDGRRWLVDAGLPLYAPLPLDPGAPTQRESAFHLYAARPLGKYSYRIERSHHPQPYCFTLIDRVVPEAAYREVLAADYGPGGNFLDRVIVTKVVGKHVCRFDGGKSPYELERFRRELVDRSELSNEPSHEIARVFSLDERMIRRAISTVQTGV